MDAAELDYDLPPELIAQQPTERRDDSRLLVFDRASGDVRHAAVRDLPGELPPGTLTVVNDTRVVPARIPIARPRGEVLLLEQVDGEEWEALARPTRKLRGGMRFPAGTAEIELLEHLGEGRWRVRLDGEPAGGVPLPPYITTPLADPERYQTVYARESGSAAAPTAGLHFTPELLELVDTERVTLHVGLDTFRPLQVARVEEHRIHGERYHVTDEAWQRINNGITYVSPTLQRRKSEARRGYVGLVAPCLQSCKGCGVSIFPIPRVCHPEATTDLRTGPSS